MKIILAISLLACAGVALQDRDITAMQPAQIQWQRPDASAGMPAGMMVYHVSGEGQQGPFVDLIKFPDGTRVPLHTHSANHVVTVLSGSLTIARDGHEKGTTVEAGGFFKIPAGTPHVTSAIRETVISVSGDKPNDITFAEGRTDKKTENK